ncbi:MAG: IS200/IS605 family transposase [Phenylobacterium sp.]
MKNKKTNHSIYNLNYHIIFVIKYRHEVLKCKIEAYTKQRLEELCILYGWELISMEIMPDHIHLFLSTKPKVAPLSIATTLKSILTVDIFKEFKDLKKKYFWGSGLFSRGTYYGSAGTVSAETIKKYIEEQKLHD